MLQSIYSHAGCDHLRYCRILGHWCFNPHTHVGCDTTACLPYHVTGSFNPHTHVGCDSISPVISSKKSLCFNPHTHVGCDCQIKCLLSDCLVSIHTPT